VKINRPFSIILIISIILTVSILSGCINRYDQRPTIYPTNTPYQERTYPLRLISEKVDLDIGYKWNVGSGYILIVQAIDSNATPRQVWLSLFKEGKQIDDQVLTEGDIYNYQNIFQTTISKIYARENADRVILSNTKIYP
jgi:hypothetical protein